MIFYRIYQDRENHSALGWGPGGARWNRPGTPLIYCSNRLSLSMVEHLSIRGAAVSDFEWRIAELDIQSEIIRLEIEKLPDFWYNRPHAKSTQQLGTLWAQQRSSLVLGVPSARLPLNIYEKEYNLLINPFHPDFSSKIEVLKDEKILFELNQ
ncbi:MAG: RES family NAD+ phosphorylase [Leeuwenhoekiella sp.]